MRMPRPLRLTLSLLVVMVVALSTQAAAARTRPQPVRSNEAGNAGGTWWHAPLGNQPWQWELDHPLSLTNEKDMGTDALLPNGRPAPDPVIYDIDGFETAATTVASLQAKGFHVVCYIEVGAAENYRPDYASFPASALGKTVPGYTAERYVDIRNARVVSIIEARL